MTPDDRRHGTAAGHRAHYQPGSDKKPCDPCRSAHAEYRRNLWRRKYAMRVSELYISSLGTARRIHALQAIGWRFTDIDKALGHGDGSKGGPNYSHNLIRQSRVHVHTAQKVAAVYDELSMTPGPSSRTRAIARDRGWAPPLAWNDIDDPDEKPAGQRHSYGADYDSNELVDEATVLRILAGETLRSNQAERHEVMRRWLAMGNSERSLCIRMGWKDGRYVSSEGDAA